MKNDAALALALFAAILASSNLSHAKDGDEGPFNGEASRLVECNGLQEDLSADPSLALTYSGFSVVGFGYGQRELEHWGDVLVNSPIPRGYPYYSGRKIRRVVKRGNDLAICATESDLSLFWYLIQASPNDHDDLGRPRYSASLRKRGLPEGSDHEVGPLHYGHCKLKNGDPNTVYLEIVRRMEQAHQRDLRSRCRKGFFGTKCPKDEGIDPGPCTGPVPDVL